MRVDSLRNRERERDWERWKRKNGLIKARKTAKEKGHNSRERECM